MFSNPASRNSLEILESRIAPASAAAALPTDPLNYVKATIGGPVEVKAGQVLTTGGFNSGSYLLYVEKGDALVFFTDLNNNKNADFNEITGISAGDGLRMVCFTDIHGDIVTNLIKQTTTTVQSDGSLFVTSLLRLSDADSNFSNDPVNARGDGRVLVNSQIEKIEMRSLTISDLADQNNDGLVTDADVQLRKVESTYSIFGNIYAGRGFGATDGGLIIDSTGMQNFGLEGSTVPQIGSIRTGSAVSGLFYSFGASRGDDSSGTMLPFVTPRGQGGGDIIGVHPAAGTKFNLTGLYAGNGGVGAPGGSIIDVTVTSDDSGGYEIIAGNGGRGAVGGAGGAITSFADLGSITGRVYIRSGSGGNGSTGLGGAGGDVSFGNFNVHGNISILLGNGGDGFTGGGNGATLLGGVLTTPGSVAAVAGNGYGTTHMASTKSGVYQANIGTRQAVDFDGDGFGDFVYTTKGLSQLVVMFGDGAGGFRTTTGPGGLEVNDRIYLNGERNSEALTIADLNGDGLPDIATASLDAGSHAGVEVFLSQFEDSNNDGLLSATEDVNRNGKNDFLGFTPGRYSALPLLEKGDPDTDLNAIFPFYESPIQIGGLTAGDYDGDGIAELAMAATYYTKAINDPDTGVTEALAFPVQVLVFLKQDREMNNLTGLMESTGQFYVDLGTKAVKTPTQNTPALALQPFLIIGDGSSEDMLLESTALTTSPLTQADAHDVVIVGVRGGGSPVTVDYSVRTELSPTPLVVGTWSMAGMYDANRAPTDPDPASEINPTTPAVGGFVVTDIDNDGVADLGVIATGGAAEDYLFALRGDGVGNNVTVGNFSGDAGTDQAGIPLDPPPGVSSTKLAIKTADVDRDGVINDLAILTGLGNVYAVSFPSGTLGGIDTYGLSLPNNEGPVLFDIHYNNTADLADPAFAVADLALETVLSFASIPDPITGELTGTNTSQGTAEAGTTIVAGNGGVGLVGAGGTGGSLGVRFGFGTLTVQTSGSVQFFAGAGGDGFYYGGDGGSIAGVVLLPPPGVDPNSAELIPIISGTLVAGNGGRGVSGVGGNGGTLADNCIAGGGLFIAGDGGVGLVGGNGGSVIGNGTKVYYDTLAAGVQVFSGKGGNGTLGGGSGGDIFGFDAVILGGTDGGTLSYVAGDGGNSVSGNGGAGGSVLYSSPRPNAQLETDLYVKGGTGGYGKSGGHGGNIVDFTFRSLAQAKKPALISLIGGPGGYGVAGDGGAGGSLIDIDVVSTGVTSSGPVYAPYDFSRALAGNGGGSATGRGGDGGDVLDMTAGSSQGAFLVAAGCGGDGLTYGGRGGHVKTLNLATAASTISKVLVVAGSGGSAAAFIPNFNDDTANQDENSFGGTVGRGGKGGNIIGVVQNGQTGAHFDLIAGNGGDTINYGTVFDPKPFVGKGGSIRNVTLAGDIGNVDPTANVTIQSYNRVLEGESMRDYIDKKFRVEDSLTISSLSDADGNVGIVVGAAGRNKSVVLDPQGNPGVYVSQPATFGKNGKLTDVVARNILAAVAGSTERIASIQYIRNVQVLPGGIMGADVVANGLFDYLDKDGLPVPAGPNGKPAPVLEGRLLDGAIVGKVFYDLAGNKITPTGRSFAI